MSETGIGSIVVTAVYSFKIRRAFIDCASIISVIVQTSSWCARLDFICVPKAYSLMVSQTRLYYSASSLQPYGESDSILL